MSDERKPDVFVTRIRHIGLTEKHDHWSVEIGSSMDWPSVFTGTRDECQKYTLAMHHGVQPGMLRHQVKGGFDFHKVKPKP